MKLPGLKSRVSSGLPGFAGLPTLRSGRHSSPGLKAWGFLAGLINFVTFEDVTPYVPSFLTGPTPIPTTEGKEETSLTVGIVFLLTGAF
jgi:hypothetical protein